MSLARERWPLLDMNNPELSKKLCWLRNSQTQTDEAAEGTLFPL